MMIENKTDQSAIAAKKPQILGLSQKKVLARRAEGRGNDVQFKTSRSLLEILRENLFTFFNMVLFVLGFMLVLMGQPIEAFITTGVLLINVIVATAQEVRAKRKLDQIALLTRPRATVIREGEESKIDPREVVLGDILVIGPGDQIVVDGEVIGDGQVDVDEALLSGESDLIPKRAGDQLYSGSFCVTGSAMYVAQKVGGESLANKLTAEARTFTRNLTPLQKEVNLIIRVLLALVVFFAILLTIGSVFDNAPVIKSVREASVLFGLAPSSLFLMIVVAYAVGAVRLADKGALVQQANSVESLCNVTLLCLDKTGTLTTNRINLVEMKMLEDDKAANFKKTELQRILGDFAISATTSNRTNEALIEAFDGRARPFIEEVPFSSARGWSALSFDSEDLAGVFVLGAPEMVAACLSVDEDTGESILKEGLEKYSAEKADQGLRVLLFSYTPTLIPLIWEGREAQLPENLIPLCSLVFSDELRPDAKKTLQGFAEAGIELKIISGDSPKTVAALAKQAGLVNAGDPSDESWQTVSGLELANMSEGQFAQTAMETTIFGRINPREKEHLVRVFREQGHYVAMTGDGVNDVLALKQANLGIAMQSGSQATRNVADMVLLQDSFSVLPDAFKEGQRILGGMQDILRLYMTRILVLAVLVAAIAIAGVGFPFTPQQNAFISFLTLSIPAFALAVWARPGPVPRSSMTRKLAHFVLPAVLTVSMAGLIVYLYFLVTTHDIVYAQHALTYTMVACGLLLIVFVEPPTKAWVGGDNLSGDWRPTLLAIGLFVVFGLFLAFPPLRFFYGLIFLRQPMDYLTIAIVVVLWALGLRYIWRARVVEHYLNINLSRSGSMDW